MSWRDTPEYRARERERERLRQEAICIGREILGLSQATLAERSGVPVSRLQWIERGACVVTVDEFVRLWECLSSQRTGRRRLSR